MSKTAIWDSLKRVPTEHLKGFKRQGGFQGTAIKPMWTFHRMTEEFGPCGTGWGINEPTFTVQIAGPDTLVFCTASVWYQTKDQILWGVGGDKVATTNKYGPVTDDEAYKKAFTDAVTNALKTLGAGADVHMGLFDGNKYVDEKKPKDTAGPHSADYDAPRDPDSETAFLTGTAGASKAPVREDFKVAIEEMRATLTRDGQKEWLKANRERIDSWPADWMTHFDEAYQEHRSYLEAKIAA